jgi:hypothetical protein
MADKPTPTPIKLLEGAPFIQVPRFFTELMGTRLTYTSGDRAGQNVERIPASFWKYLFYLWGWIMNGNVNREARLSMREFPVRTDAAVKWTAALSVSGLFEVEKGRYTAQHDQKTFFRYKVAASEDEWTAFIEALDKTLVRIKGWDKEKQFRQSTGGFTVWLAQAVDQNRASYRLAPVNIQFLNDAADGKIKDMEGRPIAERMKDGSITSAHYQRSSNRLRIEGHKRNCDCTDCVNFRYEMREESEERPPY